MEEKVNVFYQAIEFAMAGCNVKFRMCLRRRLGVVNLHGGEFGGETTGSR